MRGFLLFIAVIAFGNAAWVALEWFATGRAGAGALLGIGLKIEMIISLIGGAALAGLSFVIGSANDIELRLREINDQQKHNRL